MLRRKMRERFSIVFKTRAGLKFVGEFGDPNAAPRPRREIQNLPHRTVVTDRRALVEPGECVSAQGVEYLLVAQHTLTNVRRFLAVEVNHHAKWERFQQVIDPVAKVVKSSQAVTLDERLPITIEPQRTFDEQGFEQNQYRIFTAADVKKDDRIDGRKVMNVVNLLGLNAVEVA